MTTQQAILFRHTLLRQLAVASPAALDLETLSQGIRLAGFPPQQTASQLAALEEKTWIQQRASSAHAGHLRYVLTAAGRTYAETQGLA